MPTIKPSAHIEVYTYTAPAHWACYFMNDDCSGMDDDDIVAADAFIDWVGLGAPVGVEDHGFTHWHDAHRFSPYGADCATYTFFNTITNAGKP